MNKQLVESFHLDDDKSILCLSQEVEEEYKVFYLNSNNPEDMDQLVEVSREMRLVFDTNKQESKRSYYAWQNGDDYRIFADRILKVDGMFNFRDIGGYPAMDNKTVQWGRLYRGDHLFNLDDSGLEFVEGLKIDTIIDLRSDAELLEYPNKSIGKATRTLHLDPKAHAAELSAALMDGNSKPTKNQNSETLKRYHDEMSKQQITFVNDEHCKKVFGTMLHEIANNPKDNYYIHCRGGKDRTGYALMLIEGLLGVPVEYMVYDYILTNTARKNKNIAYWNKFYGITKDISTANTLYGIFAAVDDFIIASINEIMTHYGGFESYVLNELGLTFEEVTKIRSNFLE
ncbi:tyrosine-protein phosphatase [Erysipelothrix inopinata]|uniref:Tyrosine-protein phosphatase n=1 Tax=Erysipelothrix inopinata TaxID=225084 RepID=A0A7G9RW96_9FIRM|nr:tyrosine-protein phosphatase [Erysipelothrix inopinata]QNN59871.1 tyrosine-protein phosphatase [Erysipelothrix inopinata]